MKIHKFRKLEDEVKKKDFASSYAGLNSLMKGLSILGNLASIFAASFFMMQLMSSVISNTVIVGIISFTLLISLELIKRLIFDKFSLEFIRSKYSIAKREVIILMFFAIAIIYASFYSSLSGAKSFADRNEQIETVIDSAITIYEDSLRINVYEPEINQIDLEIADMKADVKTKDDEMTLINSKLELKGYLTPSEKERIRDIKEENKYNREQISLKEDKILALNVEFETKLNEYKSSTQVEGSIDKEANKSNSIVFVVISTLIEFLILIGIFFSKYYSFVSYNEFRRKMDKDPRYQRWVLYSEVMEIIYMNDAVIGDKLPTQKDILEFCKIDDIYMSKNELSEFLKLLTALNIIKSSGPYKFIHKEKEESEEILSKYFKI